MCLAIPGKVVEIDHPKAEVDFGGVTRKVDITFVDAGIGDYVIVHAGYAIEILDQEEARKTLETFEEVLSREEMLKAAGIIP